MDFPSNLYYSIEKQLSRKDVHMTAKKDAPQKSQITFGKFDNVDIRVGRIVSAPMATGTKSPCRVITVDVGHLGERISVGQYALVPENELLGKNIVVCVNLGERPMGDYKSQALVLGVPHPDSPEDQSQAIPLLASELSDPGTQIY